MEHKDDKYKAISHLAKAELERYQRERARVIVEIHDLEQRFVKWKEKAPAGTDNNFEDAIQMTKDELAMIERVHLVARELLQKISGFVPIDY